MWPKWLADTLERSTVDAQARGADAKPQRVRGFETAADASDASDAADWDEVVGLNVHEGYNGRPPEV